MNKIKNFCKKHEKALWFIGGSLTVVALGSMGIKIRNMSKRKNMIRIEPDFYSTIDEALEAFLALEKTTDYAVLCSSFGSYGVIDETPVIK